LFEYVSKRPALLQDCLPRRRSEKGEVNPDGPEFHRLLRIFQLQRDFAKIILSTALAAQNAQVRSASVKLLQGGRHVVLVYQQRFVRLWHFLAIDLLPRGQ